MKNKFISICIKNRKYLGFSFKDISNCLIDVSEEEYKQFEDGKYNLNRENIIRLMRVLCIKEKELVDLDSLLQLDDNELNEEEKEDIKGIASDILGEVYD